MKPPATSDTWTSAAPEPVLVTVSVPVREPPSVRLVSRLAGSRTTKPEPRVKSARTVPPWTTVTSWTFVSNSLAAASKGWPPGVSEKIQ